MSVWFLYAPSAILSIAGILFAVWKMFGFFVHLADLLVELRGLPKDFQQHAEDDAAFQEWIIARFEAHQRGPIRFESEDLP